MLDQQDRKPLKTLSPTGNDCAGGQMLLQHRARIEANDLTACPHIEVKGQESYFWMASIPTAYLCAGCLTTAPRPIDCDHCHGRSGALERYTLNVGGRAVHVSFLCPTCATAEEAAKSS
ncbi:hypothetical protein [Nocardioides psychrotolerans]|nr:hypothetical protein [Nocardioides psychrotolerans]